MEDSKKSKGERKMEIKMRRGKCFLTDQSCNHRERIIRIIKESHRQKIVNVFVAMSFSPLEFMMYDMFCNEIAEMIKAKFLFDDNGELKYKEAETLSNIEDIRFTRADLEISTGHVVCNRVCDPIQQADIVVVDVSHPNPNVFYELGLAFSMGKRVLPICFTKRYYFEIKSENKEGLESSNNVESFPWLKELHQFFSLYCFAKDTPKRYPKYTVSEERKKYEQYPFSVKSINFHAAEIMYALLGDPMEEKENTNFNTLMLYSEKGFENKETFETVIKNTKRLADALHNPELFHGDRILIIAQNEKLYEEDKDSKHGKLIGYNVADITQLSVIKAIRQVAQETAYLCYSSKKQNNVERIPWYGAPFIAYPKSPLFLERIMKNLHRELAFLGVNYDMGDSVKAYFMKQTSQENSKNLLELICSYIKNKTIDNSEQSVPEFETPFYTYLNVMITYMRYAKQVIIDTHANDITAYFWMGVCHAAGVDTIRIERNYTENDRKMEEGKTDNIQNDVEHEIAYYRSIRPVFDVAGLWCAYINANNIKNLCYQLYLVESGICELHHAHVKKAIEANIEACNFLEKSRNYYEAPKKRIEQQCERYYRHIFWQKLCNESLQFVIGAKKENKCDGKGKWQTGVWDQKVTIMFMQQMLRYQTDCQFSVDILTQNDKNEYQHIKQANVPGLVPKAQIIIGDDLANGESDTFLTNIKYGKTTIQQCDKNTENRTMQRKRKKYSWVQPTEACLTCGEGCNVFKNNKYIAYGRLFLYQNLSGNGGSPITVYIMGGTGIVTYALASIFTGHDFHGNPFNEKTDNEESEAACILSQIQDEIRDKYIDNFQKNLNGEETGNKNTKILEHVSDMIAPYFLPFLSKEDIHGLERSFEYYLHDLFGYNIRNQDSFTQGSTDETAEKKFLEDACEKAINTITKKLTEIISKKLFVEVVFKVEIEQDFNEKDYWTSLKKYSIKEYVINLVEV